jgi:hypothetical protein
MKNYLHCVLIGKKENQLQVFHCALSGNWEKFAAKQHLDITAALAEEAGFEEPYFLMDIPAENIGVQPQIIICLD